MIGLEAVCEILVELGEPRHHGRTRDGERRVTPIVGGMVRGLPGTAAGAGVHALRATILPGGGDRQLIRPDGSVEIDAAYEARTDAGALIAMRVTGIRRPAGTRMYFRVAVRFETAAPGLAELQDALFVADGVREDGFVRHTVYRVG